MRELNPDHGNVTIIVALMITVLFGMGALVIDMGAMLLDHSELQAGTDAAAISIARQCAQHAVDPLSAPACDDILVANETNRYLDANATDPADVSFDGRELRTFLSGRAGMVRVAGRSTANPMFGRVARLTNDEALEVKAAATARWGPVLSDIVGPLTGCKGALPAPGAGEVAIVSQPDEPPPYGQCDGADDALPLGWIAGTDSTCSLDVRIAPPELLTITPSDEPPMGLSCQSETTDLLNAIASSAPPEDRTRVMVVHDTALGGAGTHPSYSLIAFEFTGASLRNRSEPAIDPCDGFGDDPEDDNVQCIRGYVREWLPPDDSPIAGLGDEVLPGVLETTVLDTRLEE
jgi:hypothetical protein